MAKIKLTKNELKKQKDGLKRFLRYLPTLQLKKQQLQMELRHVEEALRSVQNRFDREIEFMERWVDVLGEDAGVEGLLSIEAVITQSGNIAGIDIPVFDHVIFREEEYDLFTTPLWIDRALHLFRELLSLQAEIMVLEEQMERLRRELTVTTQRVNLFEKVKIPETRENIRVIQIYLGDQQTAAVVRGKISKNKLVERTQ